MCFYSITKWWQFFDSLCVGRGDYKLLSFLCFDSIFRSFAVSFLSSWFVSLISFLQIKGHLEFDLGFFLLCFVRNFLNEKLLVRGRVLIVYCTHKFDADFYEAVQTLLWGFWKYWSIENWVLRKLFAKKIKIVRTVEKNHGLTREWNLKFWNGI